MSQLFSVSLPPCGELRRRVDLRRQPVPMATGRYSAAVSTAGLTAERVGLAGHCGLERIKVLPAHEKFPKMPQKAVKVMVELDLHAVFKHAVDPAAVAELLEWETAKIELIQLIPPVGETLAFYEEDARTFLFPEPKLAPSYPGVDREILMTRAHVFPGIAPRLEFSTRTTIKECCSKIENGICTNTPLKEASRKIIRKKAQKLGCKLSKKANPSPGKKRAPHSKEQRYDKSTGMSKLRSVSPATRRHIAELSENNTQRLAHLNLGPNQQESSPHSRPDSAVRHVRNSWPPVTSTQPISQASLRKSTSRDISPKARLYVEDSHETTRSNPSAEGIPRTLEDAFSSTDTDDLVNYTLNSSSCLNLKELKRSPPNSTMQPSQSQFRNCSPLKQSSHSTWESIHERVRSLLTSVSARERLSLGATESEIDDVLQRRSVSPKSSPHCRSPSGQY
ncbi:spermatogenesis associated 6-like protein isoform X2 [Lepisosteus oculatus]|uniref:spermatogenesis associated 6-like protein isoform X2 n=1 Tax=Lepisosteus oculatus TaxID=7918 RepID=UPI00073FF625|nr:PREDICTED: spermatogenesis-associated protein 6-like isoform X2 [Lepisosteus oculatus]